MSGPRLAPFGVSDGMPQALPPLRDVVPEHVAPAPVSGQIPQHHPPVNPPAVISQAEPTNVAGRRRRAVSIFGEYGFRFRVRDYTSDYLDANHSTQRLLQDCDRTIIKLSRPDCYEQMRMEDLAIIKALAVRYGYSREVSRILKGLGNDELVSFNGNNARGSAFKGE